MFLSKKIDNYAKMYNYFCVVPPIAFTNDFKKDNHISSQNPPCRPNQRLFQHVEWIPLNT